MTSTDIPRISRRLPPLPGLLDDTLDQAIRARQRRVLIADHPGSTLAALRVSDEAIDQAVQSASLYGQDAVHQLESRIAAASGAAQDAAVFLRMALAVHTQDPALFTLAAQYAPQHQRAIRDACWFYPVPLGPFSDDSGHIVTLFHQSDDALALRLLALELAGRRNVKVLRPRIEALLTDPAQAPMAHFALACMDVASDATRHFVHHSLMAGDPAHGCIALDIAAVDPRLADDTTLDHALRTNPAAADAAWAILAGRQPRHIYDYAQQCSDLPAAIPLRVAALTGYLDGIIAACADMADSDGPVSPMQADLLLLTLGELPVEARCQPNDRAQKSSALRALLLRVCRRAHIALHNDADRCPWDATAILAAPEQAAQVRLRGGMPWRAGIPAFVRVVNDITHALRQWLYIECATLGGHAMSLSAHDVVRRQELALMFAEFVDELRTD